MADVNPYTSSLPELRAALVDAANQRVNERQQAEAQLEAMRPVFEAFLQRCPEFVPTESNLAYLAAEMAFGGVMDPRDFLAGKVTVDHFVNSHAMNQYQQVYESAPAPSPETLSLAELRSQASGETAPDPEYTKPLEELRRELYSPPNQPVHPEPVPAPTPSDADQLQAMPLSQLREVAGASHGT